MSHLGRPDGVANKKYSMAPCVPVLKVSRKNKRTEELFNILEIEEYGMKYV